MPDDQTTLPARRTRTVAIKNLPTRIPERGHVKIGGKGEVRTSARGGEYQLPVKYDHFVITTMVRGKDGNFVRDEELHKLFGDKPTELPVRLLYDDEELNFQSRYACYIGKKVWCSGDGERATRMKGRPDDPGPIQYEEVACTCPRQDPAYKGKDKCKMNGNLSVLIDGAPVGGVWKFRTTSFHSVTGISSTLNFLRSVTGGVLANLPLRMRISPQLAYDPDDNQITIYIVSLEFAGSLDDLREGGHRIALARASAHLNIEHIEHEARRLLLAAPIDVPLLGDENADIVAEFYPEQQEDAPPRPTRAQFPGAPIEGEVLAPGEAEEEAEPATPFNADEYEAGYLGLLAKADTAATCRALLDTEHDDLFRLDPETRERLIRKTNAKWGDIEAAAHPKPAKAPNPSLSVADGAAPAEAAAEAAPAKQQPAPAPADPSRPELTKEQWEILGGGLIDAAKECVTQRDLDEVTQSGRFLRYAEMKEKAPAAYAAVDKFIKNQRKRLPV